jgi:phosphoserine phosphatase|tara:strand:+ start:34869 stop:35990 length:1122 start_codon:yes stop_codon:yes gene_type:complete
MSQSTRLEVSMDSQSLDLYVNNEPARTFKISTSEKGMGFAEGSFRTPTGRFVISEKVGEGEPLYTKFKARVPIGVWDQKEKADDDLILTRILRMGGIDPENANTLERYIYIHGTNREDLIGIPSSHGCIRMSNRDMVELFDAVETGSEVAIHPLTEHKMKLLFLDCDSTLSSIEGIDELARLSDPAIFAEVVALTNAAMDGEVPLDEVFRRRMEIIRPSKEMVEEVCRMYIETVVSGATELVSKAVENSWLPVIISGGFAPIIRPLAERLGIRHVEAVPLYFNDLGEYAGYGEDYPSTRNLGKNEIIREWTKAMLPQRVVMIGDGISDLETKPDVDLMIGFGGVVQREKVRNSADLWLEDFSNLDQLISTLEG